MKWEHLDQMTAIELMNMLTMSQREQIAVMLNNNAFDLMGSCDEFQDQLEQTAREIRAINQ